MTRNSTPLSGKSSRTQSKNQPKSGGSNKSRGRSRGQHRHKKGSGNESTQQLMLYGIHSVRTALQNSKRKKIRLIVTENALTRLGSGIVDESGVKIDFQTAQYLDRLLGPDAVHQGVVLECLPLDTLDASELFHLADAKMLLVLDQLTDPHNVGAILRSATALGVDAVLTTSRNSAHETAVLAKSASGALDLMPIIHLRNLSKSLQELNDMGFVSIGLDSEGPKIFEQTLEDSKAAQVALVLGAEGKGLRQQTRETCSALARLDMPGQIKSLNVSNAAVLSLYLVSSHLRMLSR